MLALLLRAGTETLHPSAWRTSGTASPNAVRSAGEHRASQVSGEPQCQHALLFDLGETVRARLLQHDHTAFRCLEDVGSHDASFRGSITRPTDSLSTLHPVRYQTTRKTRFRLAANLFRVGFAPLGSIAQFPKSPLLPKCPSFPGAPRPDPNAPFQLERITLSDPDFSQICL